MGMLGHTKYWAVGLVLARMFLGGSASDFPMVGAYKILLAYLRIKALILEHWLRAGSTCLGSKDPMGSQ